MAPLLLVLLPLAFALLAIAIPSDRWRPLLLPIAGAAQLAAFAVAASGRGREPQGSWLVLDPLALLAAGTVIALFFCCSLYAPAYLRVRSDRKNRVFTAGLLALLSMLTMIPMARHFGLLWIGIEATTLCTAPLVYFNQNKQSLEAAWKYLLVCSFGIALALLGSFFLAYAALKGGQGASLLYEDLLSAGPSLSKPWLHAAFATLLVGYGTKMGLAPMHTWKPDAYGEAPGVLGALLAGGLTSCAFIAVLRVLAIATAAGESGYARAILIGMGILSMVFAAVFLTGQRDLKRMLAYSSVEHMGILVLGAGVGGLGLFGALLHMINNALCKGMLFLAAGNLHRAYESRTIDRVRGALLRTPCTAWIFVLGFLAIAGSPPFGPFVSEFTVARAAIAQGHGVAAVSFLVLLMAVFLGMSRTVLSAVQGRPPEDLPERAIGADEPGLTAPVLLLFVLVLALGVWLPEPLRELLERAARAVEGR